MFKRIYDLSFFGGFSKHLKKKINLPHVSFVTAKELSLWNKIKYLNHNIFRTRCRKPLILQYLRYATFGSKDTVISKSEFVAKAQFLWA